MAWYLQSLRVYLQMQIQSWGSLGPFYFLHLEAGVFVWGADGVLLVVSICQLLLIDVIVSFLIFTLGFNMEVTIQIILEQS